MSIINCAILCHRSFPSTKMRAEPLRKIGWDVLYKPPKRKYDVLIVLKRAPSHQDAVVRRSCDRLVFDPLDYWATGRSREINFREGWASLRKSMQFDDLVATSPAAAETMLGLGVPVHVVRHHADPEIDLSWYDPDGPIVYAGLAQFVKSVKPVLTKAGSIIDREVKFSHAPLLAQRGLRGASLVLAVRTGRYAQCSVCQFLKPLVKLENAAAMNAPIVYNGSPTEVSVRPGHVIAFETDYADPERLAGVLQRGLESEPARDPFTLDHYLTKMKELFGGRT